VTFARSFAVAVLLAASARSLPAQQAVFRLGGVRATYADTLSGTAGTANAEVSWLRPRARFSLAGTFSQFATGGWAAQAGGSAAGLVLGGLGLYADGAANALGRGDWSGTASGGVFGVRTAGPLVLSGSAGGGAVRRVDATADAMITATLRGRLERGRWGTELGLVGTRAGDSSFADASVSLDVAVSSLRLGTALGTRVGDLPRDTWLQGRAELRLAPFAAVEAAAGSYPRDLTGFVGGVYVWVGVRLQAGRAVVGPGSALRSASRDLTLQPAGRGRVRLTVRASGMRTLAIAGEWNGWSPQPLRRGSGGRWSVVLPLAAGTYRFALLADGERWFVPDGVPTMPDDFGGNAGLLVVGA
jgi:hypothetical protein